MSTDAIQANLQHHANLLSQLSSLDYAPSALAQQDDYISTVKTELSRVTESITKLSKKTSTMSKEAQDLKDSTARRFAHKIVGKKEKFNSKAEAKEKEYFQALEEEHIAKGKKDILDKNLAEATGFRSSLLSATEQHKALRAQLEALYHQIFNGPSPSFPEEDHLERQLSIAQSNYETSQTTLNREALAEKSLASAKRAFEAAMYQMQEALSYSTMDMFGGGSMADWMERSALGSAANLLGQALMHVEQAQRAQPLIENLPRMQVAQGSIMSDVFFDNIFTDHAFHQKIKASAAQMQMGQNKLNDIMRDSAQRKSIAVQQVSHANEILRQARLDLENKRREIFEHVSNGSNGGYVASQYPSQSPPGYAPPAQSQFDQQQNAPPPSWSNLNPYAASMSS